MCNYVVVGMHACINGNVVIFIHGMNACMLLMHTPIFLTLSANVLFGTPDVYTRVYTIMHSICVVMCVCNKHNT